MTCNSLQVVSLPFAMPAKLQDLRAFYWTLDRIAESVNDLYNQPLTEDIGNQIADWGDQVRRAQGDVVAAVKDLPTSGFDLEMKMDVLLHWSSQCGEGIPAKLKLITDELARART